MAHRIRRAGAVDPPETEDDDFLKARNRKRMTRMARLGALSKVVAAESSLGIEPDCDDTRDRLRELHTARSRSVDVPVLSNDKRPPPLRFLQGDVAASIASFPRASSGGPAGLSPDHLKTLLSSSADGCCSPETASRFLDRMTGLLGRLVVLHVLLYSLGPPSLASYICGADLYGLRKEDQGAVRPLPCGATLRNLVSKCGFREFKDDAAAYLGPQRSDSGALGVDTPVQLGVSFGAEAAVHSLQNVFNALGGDNSYGLLLDDFENAFNITDRQNILEEVAAHFPSLLPCKYYSYEQPSHLFGPGERFSSQKGCQQRDSLCPFLF